LLIENKKQGSSIEYNNGEEINLDNHNKYLKDNDLLLIKLADVSKLQQYNLKETGVVVSLDSGSIVEISGRSN
jgi:hypothetical protein